MDFSHFNFIELGIFLASIAYVYTQWKSGGSKASADLINTYKDQVGINSTKVSDLTHEVGVLTGQLKEKDERLKLLEALIQGRNPEQIQFMADMRKFTEAQAAYMADSTRTMGEISVFMHNLNVKTLGN